YDVSWVRADKGPVSARLSGRTRCRTGACLTLSSRTGTPGTRFKGEKPVLKFRKRRSQRGLNLHRAVLAARYRVVQGHRHRTTERRQRRTSPAAGLPLGDAEPAYERRAREPALAPAQ